MTDRQLTALALSRASFLRALERHAVLSAADTPTMLCRLSTSGLQRLLGRRPRASWEPRQLLSAAEADAACLTRYGLNCTFYGDCTYPAALAEIHDPPLVLFCRGDWPEVAAEVVAVVGTRAVTGAGRRAAFSLGCGLASAGAVVASGLAQGVDSEAHAGACAAHGHTVAVLGQGIARLPRGRVALARRILDEGGMLMSEYPPGTPPLKHHFPARNRIIAGMARATVVVEAPHRSGALITAQFALDEGRDLLVHSVGAAPASARAAGSAALAEAGAPVILDAADLTHGGTVPAWTGPQTGSREAGAWLAQAMRRELAGQLVRAHGAMWET